MMNPKKVIIQTAQQKAPNAGLANLEE